VNRPDCQSKRRTSAATGASSAPHSGASSGLTRPVPRLGARDHHPAPAGPLRLDVLPLGHPAGPTSMNPRIRACSNA
jgi:hypothetical protein